MGQLLTKIYLSHFESHWKVLYTLGSLIAIMSPHSSQWGAQIKLGIPLFRQFLCRWHLKGIWPPRESATPLVGIVHVHAHLHGN